MGRKADDDAARFITSLAKAIQVLIEEGREELACRCARHTLDFEARRVTREVQRRFAKSDGRAVA